MRRKGGAEYEDKHLAGAACDGSYHLPGAGIAADPAEKGDKKFIYPFLSLLCTLCKSFRNDIPRHIVGNRFLLVRTGRLYGSSCDCLGRREFIPGFYRCMYGSVSGRTMAVTVSDLLKLLHMVINERKTDIFLGFLRFFLAESGSGCHKNRNFLRNRLKSGGFGAK